MHVRFDRNARARFVSYLLFTSAVFAAQPLAASAMGGHVSGGNAPIAGSTVTAWVASDTAPREIGKATTNAEGQFSIDVPPTVEGSLYLTAQGGRARAHEGDNPAIMLATVLGAAPPAHVTINEFTTIDTAFTHAQFLDERGISGTPLSLSIAAGNMANFVDLEGGGWGAVIADGLNASQTPTMANFGTLANVMAGCITEVRADACSLLFAAATGSGEAAPRDTFAAIRSIARFPGHQPARVFALLDEFYPVPAGKAMRPTPFLPYLSFAPSSWVLPLKFAGGGVSGGGKLMFDSQGNVWVGNNFIVGGQSQSILWNGNLSKFAPNGKPLSPAVTGFTGGGLLGVGFGLAIDAHDNVWADGYASKNITQFTNAGTPLSPADGWAMGGKLGEMQGIIVVPNGDIWTVDQGKAQLIHVPGGDPARARIHCQNRGKNPLDNPCGLFAPFHLAIDQQDRIWVSNSIGSQVIRFSTSDPTRVDKFEVGYGGSGLAIDSLGNVWHADRFGSSEKGHAKLVELMALYATMGEAAATENLTHNLSAQTPGFWSGGSVSVLKPDGSKAAFSPVSGNGLGGPWAVAVDGNDNVWVSNFTSAEAGSIVQLCGFRPETCPPGTATGQAISPPAGYIGGGMQQLVDVGIGPAGDVWVTNNWEIDAGQFGKAPEALSTRGAGQGVVVFFGMAKPVLTPLIGPPRTAQ